MSFLGLRAALVAASIAGVSMAGAARAEDEKPPTWLPENFTASLTGTSDYVFRGVSQTSNLPALQFTGEWTPEGGPIYIGAFVSNIKFANTVTGGNNARVELDLLAGVRGELGILKWDIGGIAYIYPGQKHNNPAFNTNFDYVEGTLKTSWDIFKIFTWVTNIYVSPSFQGDADNALYVEAGADYTLPWWDIALSARYGRQFIDQNGNFGLRDFSNWSFTVSKEFFGRIVVGAGYYDTSLSRSDCGGQTICDARGVGYVTFKF